MNEFAVEVAKAAFYRVSMKPPRLKGVGRSFPPTPLREASQMGQQNSMSYPGQGRPDDALGSSQDKAKPQDR